jgi:predicted adenylyl cyclase CyaB
MRNVEIKARLHDVDSIRARAEALADSPPIVIGQTDTFFPCPNARLKLRVFDDGSGELIRYERPDTAGPKESRYDIARIPEAEPLRAVLSAALGTRCVVRKRRVLYVVGQTRVHLDDVDGLGAFLELEVVLRSGQSTTEGEVVARDLMARLGITPDDLVAQAYADLLEQQSPAAKQ